jgi:hypothetical protein
VKTLISDTLKALSGFIVIPPASSRRRIREAIILLSLLFALLFEFAFPLLFEFAFSEEPLPPNVDPLSADDVFNINSLADHSLDEDTSSAGPANIAILASKLLFKASILNSALFNKLK